MCLRQSGLTWPSENVDCKIFLHQQKNITKFIFHAFIEIFYQYLSSSHAIVTSFMMNMNDIDKAEL